MAKARPERMAVDSGITFDPSMNQAELDLQETSEHPFPALWSHATGTPYNANWDWHGSDPILSAISVGSLLRFGAINCHPDDIPTDSKYLPDPDALAQADREATPLSVADDSLHPVFQRKNFRSISDYGYEVLKPVLRLATDMLNRWEVLGFYKGVYLAKQVKGTPAEQKRFGEGQFWRFTPAKMESDQDVTEAKTLLDKLGDCVEWGIASSSGLKEVRAYMRTLKAHIIPSNCHPEGRASRVEMLPDFTRAILGLMPPSSVHKEFDDASSYVRTRFYMAFIMIHELAHVFHNAWWPADSIVEPFMDDHRSTELGRALEMAIFGGTLQMCGGNPSHMGIPFGFRFHDYPDSDVFERESIARESLAKSGVTRHTYYSLHMDFLCDLFYADFWTEHVERFGACNSLKFPKELGVRYKVDHEQLWKGESPPQLDFEPGLHPSEIQKDINEGLIWNQGAAPLPEQAKTHKDYLKRSVELMGPWEYVNYMPMVLPNQEEMRRLALAIKDAKGKIKDPKKLYEPRRPRFGPIRKVKRPRHRKAAEKLRDAPLLLPPPDSPEFVTPAELFDPFV